VLRHQPDCQRLRGSKGEEKKRAWADLRWGAPKPELLVETGGFRALLTGERPGLSASGRGSRRRDYVRGGPVRESRESAPTFGSWWRFGPWEGLLFGGHGYAPGVHGVQGRWNNDHVKAFFVKALGGSAVGVFVKSGGAHGLGAQDGVQIGEARVEGGVRPGPAAPLSERLGRKRKENSTTARRAKLGKSGRPLAPQPPKTRKKSPFPGLSNKGGGRF